MFTGLENPVHLVVILVIAMVVLGPKRIPDVASGLGKGIREFKDSLSGADEKPEREQLEED